MIDARPKASPDLSRQRPRHRRIPAAGDELLPNSRPNRARPVDLIDGDRRELAIHRVRPKAGASWGNFPPLTPSERAGMPAAQAQVSRSMSLLDKLTDTLPGNRVVVER
jgi:hypothetical protein